MAPTSGTALILLVAFVLPGFVTVLIQERTFKKEDAPTPFDRLLTSVYYSVWCYLLLGAVALIFDVDRPWVDALIDRYEDDPAELVWRGGLLILGPSVLVAIVTLVWHQSGASKRVQNFVHVNARHQVPTAWDFYFARGQHVYVRATLRDHSRLLGFYGDQSFAAYSKDGGDLFLERVYVPTDDGEEWFGPEQPGSRGIWIPRGEVVGMEFYDPKGVDSTEAKSVGGATADDEMVASPQHGEKSEEHDGR